MAYQTHSQNQCFDPLQLERFLNEQLDDRDESYMLSHIGDCQSCQKTLEEIAGLDQDWKDVQLLADEQENSLLNFQDRSFRQINRNRDLEMESLKEYLAPTDNPDMMGRLGSYEVCGLVGCGSTGIVVKAHEPRLNRFVAIKVLSPSYSSNGSVRTRFEREAKSIAAVRDQHVVPIHAVDEFRGIPYIVMQYVAGGSLNQRIEKQGPLGICEVVQLGMQIAKGLAAAHAVGIVHRDVKPANVLLESNVDRAIVSDFGLAQVADEASMTRTGVIAGTPQFMSPEQARGDSVDPRSDLFSLGSVLYAACTGRAPFRSETVFGVIKKVCENEPRTIREINPRISPWLESLIAKLHEKDRNERFESAQQVAEILENELAHLNSPTFVSQPERNWLKPVFCQERSRWWTSIPATLVILAATTAAYGIISFTPNQNSKIESGDRFPVSQSPQAIFGSDNKNENTQSVGPETKNSILAGADNDEIDSVPEMIRNGNRKTGKFVSMKHELPGAVVDGYTIYLPENYDGSTDDYPLLILFSSVGSAAQIESFQKSDGVPSLVITDNRVEGSVIEKSNLTNEFIVITPHVVAGESENHTLEDYSEAISEILAEVDSAYRVDASRIYLTQAGPGRHRLYEFFPRE